MAIAAAPAQRRLRARFNVFADHVAHREPRSGSPGEATENALLELRAEHSVGLREPAVYCAPGNVENFWWQQVLGWIQEQCDCE